MKEVTEVKWTVEKSSESQLVTPKDRASNDVDSKETGDDNVSIMI